MKVTTDWNGRPVCELEPGEALSLEQIEAFCRELAGAKGRTEDRRRQRRRSQRLDMAIGMTLLAILIAVVLRWH